MNKITELRNLCTEFLSEKLKDEAKSVKTISGNFYVGTDIVFKDETVRIIFLAYDQNRILNK